MALSSVQSAICGQVFSLECGVSADKETDHNRGRNREVSAFQTCPACLADSATGGVLSSFIKTSGDEQGRGKSVWSGGESSKQEPVPSNVLNQGLSAERGTLGKTPNSVRLRNCKNLSNNRMRKTQRNPGEKEQFLTLFNSPFLK